METIFEFTLPYRVTTLRARLPAPERGVAVTDTGYDFWIPY